VSSSDIFRVKGGISPETWIQATSSVSGLEGFYFSGDFIDSFDGTQAAVPHTIQTIPFISPDPRFTKSLVVTNPNTQTANVTVDFYDSAGALMSAEVVPLAGHRQVAFPGSGAFARISADLPVLATSAQVSENSLVLINGQGSESQGQRLVTAF
jgi:hypothetical protein